MTGLHVVAAIQHQIQIRQQGCQSCLVQPSHGMATDMGIERGQLLGRQPLFLLAQLVAAIEHLALQVAGFQPITVGQPQLANPGGGKIEAGRRSQATKTYLV